MKVESLRLENVRVFEDAELGFDDGWNVVTGANGAGKSTLIEAIFLLSHGRSFRARSREALLRSGRARYAVFGKVQSGDRTVRVGLSRGAKGVEARVDGEDVALGELVRRTAVTCFEPGSHELIGGAAMERRRYLDWGVFHVEQDFLGVWRRYERALRQRNALLRSSGAVIDLDPWDHELAAAAEPLVAMRARYLSSVRVHAERVLADFLPELGRVEFELAAPPAERAAMVDALRERRQRDRDRGHTGVGPHRMDWSFAFEGGFRREHLSRGQEKLCALAMMLAQARHFAATRGEWPIICLDDLASEIDAERLRRVIEVLDREPAQILLTGTRVPDELGGLVRPMARFHVEQGRASRLL